MYVAPNEEFTLQNLEKRKKILENVKRTQIHQRFRMLVIQRMRKLPSWKNTIWIIMMKMERVGYHGPKILLHGVIIC